MALGVDSLASLAEAVALFLSGFSVSVLALLVGAVTLAWIAFISWYVTGMRSKEVVRLIKLRTASPVRFKKQAEGSPS